MEIDIFQFCKKQIRWTVPYLLGLDLKAPSANNVTKNVQTRVDLTAKKGLKEMTRRNIFFIFYS